jgi:23S rRNA (cytidine1920-2'-O)/16S rRNA (cytidine1409-2'-O)-methyltransferase
VLLQRGAAEVIAVDVGYGELHWKLREDPRLTVLERVNARWLECTALPYRPDLVVADVSFISLRKVLPAVLACATETFDCLAMVKPQFELSRERVGKGGVVRAVEDRREALRSVASWALDEGYAVRGFASSALPGPAGNRETFVWIAASGSLEDIESAVAKVEP